MNATDTTDITPADLARHAAKEPDATVTVADPEHCATCNKLTPHVLFTIPASATTTHILTCNICDTPICL